MKLKCSLIGAVAAMLVLTGCGSENAAPTQGEKNQLETVASQTSDEAKVPQRVIVRVPLDEAGNPTGAPEMRVIAFAGDDLTAELISTEFAKGSQPAHLTTEIDELDRDSSTQSWHWNRWNWRGGWNGWGWNRFQPRMYWGGNYWNYGFVNNWNWNGYGYGCFDRGWW